MDITTLALARKHAEDTEARKQIAALSEEIDGLKENGGNGGIIETISIPTKNLLNLAEFQPGYYITGSGRVDANESYGLTGFIAVTPGDVVTASWVNAFGVQGEMYMRYVCLYNADKSVVSGGADIKASTYVVPSGVYFMRISIYIKTYNIQTVQIEITNDGNYTQYSPFGENVERHLASDIIVPEVKFARGGYGTLKEKLDALTVNADWGLNLPPVLYALVGEELNVYFDNIVTQGRDVDYEWDVICSIGQQMERGYTVIPTESGEYQISIKCSKNGMSVQAESKIVVSNANQGDGVTRSMIILGDSTTNNNIATLKIAENFENDHMSLTLLGTRGTEPRKHEGRSGWRLSQYHTIAVDKYDSSVVNPFFNPETSKFDAAYYFANTGVAIPDYFVINLGINDTFGYADDAAAEDGIATNIAYLDATIASVMSAAPNTKICVALTIPPNYSQDAFGKAYKCGQTRDRYKRNNALWVAKLIEMYQGRETDGIYLLPLNTNLDTRYNMGFEVAKVNKRNSETYQQPIGNGGVHPVESGYWQIADVYWFFVKSFEKKSINSLLDFTTRVRTDAVNTVNSTDPHEMDENKCYPCNITGIRSHSSNVKISEYNAINTTEIQLRMNSDQTGVGMEFPVPTLEAGKTYTLTCTCDLDNMRVYLLKYNADTTAYYSNELLLFNSGTHTKTIVPDTAYVYSFLFNVQVGDQLSTFSDVTLVEN